MTDPMERRLQDMIDRDEITDEEAAKMWREHEAEQAEQEEE